MNYVSITKDDVCNGNGLRVVLWVSGCEHCCKKCQNPQTWEYSSGIQFDQSAKEEILNQLKLHGLRVVLWVSGCEHCCKKCQNPQTWEYSSGIQFDQSAKEEILNQLKLPYIEGITLSGGDPLAAENVSEVYKIVDEIRLSFPSKTIWLYTGYTIEQLYTPISGLAVIHSLQKTSQKSIKSSMKFVFHFQAKLSGYIQDIP